MDKKGSLLFSSPSTEIPTLDLWQQQFFEPETHRGFGPLNSEPLFISTKTKDDGLSLALRQGPFYKRFKVIFPEEVWNACPERIKASIRNNVGFLTSMELGIIFNLPSMHYDTPFPELKPYFR